MLASQSVWTQWLYGSWSPTAPYAVSLDANAFNTRGIGFLNQLGFWVAPDRGILVWTPVIVLMLPALVRHWRDLPDWSKALLFGGLAYTVVQGMRNPFGGGDGFYGYRLTLELVACATPALALSAVRMGRYARGAFGPLLVFQAMVIGVGAVNGRVVFHGDDVWTTHTLLSQVATEPGVLVLFLVASAAIGHLGQRIWLSPGISRM
jgi:alpha-1,2-mannosyltransferase